MYRLLHDTNPKVLNRHNIRERICGSIRELSYEEDKLRQIQGVLRFAANSYAQAEQDIGRMSRPIISRTDMLIKEVMSCGLIGGNNITKISSNASCFIDDAEDTLRAAGNEIVTGAKAVAGTLESWWSRAENVISGLFGKIAGEANSISAELMNWFAKESKDFETGAKAVEGDVEATWAHRTDITRFAVREVADNPLAVELTEDGALNGHFDFYQDKSGVYHTRQPYCWQAMGGYCDFYDEAFDLGTHMGRKKFEFNVGKNTYIIWMWKGDYLNLGAGGEVGLYDDKKSSLLPGTDECSIKDSLKMTLSAKTDSKTVFDWNPGQKNWWITGFNPKVQHIDPSKLQLSGKIDFSDNKALWDAFYKKYNDDKDTKFWTFDKDKHTAEFNWE